MLHSDQPILVTGASGFIGGHVIRRLLARGCEVHCISRQNLEGLSGGLRWWRGDVADAERMDQIYSAVRPSRVIHLASEVSGTRSLEQILPITRDNLLSAIAVLLAAARHGSDRVILAGSLEEPRDGDDVAVPSSPYAAAKWSATGYARMFHSLFGLDVVVARIGMTYGPGQPDTTKLVPFVIQSLLRGEAPRLGSGRRAVDWVYVEDVAEGIELACFADRMAGRVIDLGSGRLVTIREVVEELVGLVDRSIEPRFGALEDRPLEREWIADAALTEQVLGWRARTTLEVGLAATVAWYREQSVLRPAPRP